MDTQSRSKLIEEHLEAVRRLNSEQTPGGEPTDQWPPRGYYLTWHVVVGMVLGMIGATVSLLFHVGGSWFIGEHPLRLIQVYLTFPMGQRALESESSAVLFVGCILYLVTGAIYGVVFHLIMSLFFDQASASKRFFVGSAMGLGLWVVNFYLILSWLQPVLLGGNWIIREVPFWIAALTHLAFAWTMVALDAWGRFDQRLKS